MVLFYLDVLIISLTLLHLFLEQSKGKDMGKRLLESNKILNKKLDTILKECEQKKNTVSMRSGGVKRPNSTKKVNFAL